MNRRSCRDFVLILTLLLSWSLPPAAFAQLIFNEGNAVSSSEGIGFLSVDPGKPYEGYDYGAIPYSGNANLPTNATDPGNPFAPDLSSAAGTQTSLVDGFDINNHPRGFARIQYNGGEWIELAVVDDHTDLRGYTFYWQDDFNDNGVFGELRSQSPPLTENERGAVTFSDDKNWANLRAGTIITISEQAFADEVRDDYPFNFPNTGLDDTGHDYDLRTDLMFSPFDGDDDWHIHVHLDETITLAETPADTQYFLAHSDLEVSNEQWAAKIFDASTNLNATVQDPNLELGDLDVTTGAIMDFVGENESLVVTTFGNETGGAGVGDDEAMVLLSNPDSGETDAAYFEDVDWTTFGMPNLFNRRTDVGDSDGDGIVVGDIVDGASEDDSTLSQVQDFSGMRDPVRENTYDWAADDAEFATAASWQLANDNSTPTDGPGTTWSVRLRNDDGSDKRASVVADTTVDFVELGANSGSITLELASGATLTVDGDAQPGRVLVDEGGVVKGDGTLVTSELELIGGTMSPGSTVGEFTLMGDYVQHLDSVLEMEIAGFAAGDHDLLSVTGDALLAGTLHIVLADGFSPTGNAAIEVLSAQSITGTLTLGGDADGFTLVTSATGVSLEFVGTMLAGDYNGDGAVDAADYTVWRDTLGQTGEDLAADGDQSGAIDQADYDVWKSHLGTSQSAALGSSTSAAVPEPPSVILVLLAMSGCLATIVGRHSS